MGREDPPFEKARTVGHGYGRVDVDFVDLACNSFTVCLDEIREDTADVLAVTDGAWPEHDVSWGRYTRLRWLILCLRERREPEPQYSEGDN